MPVMMSQLHHHWGINSNINVGEEQKPDLKTQKSE